MEKPQDRTEGADSFTPDTLEPLEIDDADLEFPASNIRITRDNDKEPCSDRLLNTLMEIAAIKVALEENKLEISEIIDDYYDSKNDEAKARNMARWLENIKVKKRLQAKLSILQEKKDTFSL